VRCSAQRGYRATGRHAGAQYRFDHSRLFISQFPAARQSAPRIRSVMSLNERAWKKSIFEILRAGIRYGNFTPGLGANVAAEAVVALIRGLNFGHSRSFGRAEPAMRLLTRWLEGARNT
jgi:hypothetical protein